MHGPHALVTLVFVGCLSGCAATVSIPVPVDAETRRDLDARLRERAALARTGETRTARGAVNLRGDSVVVRSADGVEVLPLHPGVSIEYRDGGSGFRRGARVGGLAGMALGLAVGLSGGSSHCLEGCTNDRSTAERMGGILGTTVLGGIAGAAVSAPLGVLFGSAVRIQFRSLDSRAPEGPGRE